jgi:hypothetical protein
MCAGWHTQGGLRGRAHVGWRVRTHARWGARCCTHGSSAGVMRDGARCRARGSGAVAGRTDRRGGSCTLAGVRELVRTGWHMRGRGARVEAHGSERTGRGARVGTRCRARGSGAVAGRTGWRGGSCTLVGARGLVRTGWHTVAHMDRGTQVEAHGSGHTGWGARVVARFVCRRSPVSMTLSMVQKVAVTYGRGMHQRDMRGIRGDALILASASARAPAVSGVHEKRGRVNCGRWRSCARIDIELVPHMGLWFE